MIINEENLALVFSGLKTVYSEAGLNAPQHAAKIAMTVPSSSRDETYTWLGQIPALREWIGPRVIQNLSAKGFTIVNKKFESTVAVRRTDIEDDRIGVFKPAFAEMAQSAKRHPEELVFGLLQSGFTANCYDGQNFFDTDHPVVQADASVASVSNMQAGSGPGWYLLDCSREVRPLIWQERIPYEFQQITGSNDSHVFTHDEYVYGVRARVNAGFGLWQLAFASKAALTPANYQVARAAMMGFAADGGKKLGVMPTVMVVPPALEADARYLLATDIQPSGGSNPWKGSCDLIVTPYLA